MSFLAKIVMQQLYLQPVGIKFLKKSIQGLSPQPINVMNNEVDLFIIE